MVVLKFGGSSVGQPGRFKNAIDIVRKYTSEGRRLVVIASALNGVTDQLVEAGNGRISKDSFMQWLHKRHSDHAALVLDQEARLRFAKTLSEFLYKTDTLIEYINKETDPILKRAGRDELLAVGERLSVRLFANALNEIGLNAVIVDAATLIKTDDNFGDGNVDFDATYSEIEAWFASQPKDVIPVVTGFIGRAPDGRTTTLGRGGSDYSASILAAGLQAERLERWTDVDGVYTSDPRKDPSAKRLDFIVMEEALSWNKAGKMGLHRKALDPLIAARIPLFVRSIDQPEKKGTEVQPRRFQQAVAC